MFAKPFFNILLGVNLEVLCESFSAFKVKRTLMLNSKFIWRKWRTDQNNNTYCFKPNESLDKPYRKKNSKGVIMSPREHANSFHGSVSGVP